MKKVIKRYGFRVIKYKSLFIILSMSSLGSIILSLYLVGIWSDLLINLGATFIGVILTVFIFDEIITRQKENEYKEAYLNSKDDLNMLANMMVTYLREPFGFRFPSEKIDINKNLEDEGTRINRESIKQILRQLKPCMSSAQVNDWKRLVMNIFLLRQKLAQIIPLYKDIIPPNLLGKALSLNKSFQALDSNFGLLADLFINEPKDWPKNNLGQKNNIRIRNNQLNILEGNIKDVLNKTELLFKELDNWKAID